MREQHRVHIAFIFIMPELEYSFCAKTYRGNYRMNAQLLLIVAVPAHAVASVALIAATPVGATIAIFLVQCSLRYRKNVVLPVPALPVKKI